MSKQDKAQIAETEEKVEKVKKVQAPLFKLAVIRIRGEVNLNKEIRSTFTLLRLFKKNRCVVLNDTPSIRGMLYRIKDYVTWGVVNEETIKLLDEKRGKKGRKYYNLHPPRGGFARKGIKKQFNVGGALGNRKEKINDLIKRML